MFSPSSLSYSTSSSSSLSARGDDGDDDDVVLVAIGSLNLIGPAAAVPKAHRQREVDCVCLKLVGLAQYVLLFHN